MLTHLVSYGYHLPVLSLKKVLQSFQEMIVRACGRKVSQHIKINQNKREVIAQLEAERQEREAWNEQLKLNFAQSKKAFEMKTLAEETTGQAHIVTKANLFSMNPLNGVLLPYQLLLCGKILIIV